MNEETAPCPSDTLESVSAEANKLAIAAEDPAVRKKKPKSRLKPPDPTPSKKLVKQVNEPTQGRRVSNVAATDVPDPIPANQVTNKHLKSTVTPSPVSASALSAGSLALLTQKSSSPTRKTSTVWVAAFTTTPSSPPPSLLADASNAGSTRQPSHLSVYIIVLIAVGASSLGIGLCIFARCLYRRRTKYRPPTPSNPILQDSPLFGGKERFSHEAWGNSGLGSFMNDFKNGPTFVPVRNDGWKPLKDNERMPEKSKASNERPPSAFMPRMTLLRTPEQTQPSTPNIGVAIESPRNNRDGTETQPLRLRDSASNNKTVRRRSVTSSIYGGVGSTTAPSDAETAFQIPRSAASPGRPKPAVKAGAISRERVQVPYRKKTPSQNSTSRVNAGGRSEKAESFIYAVPTVKTQESRDRDTKALTSALGLPSPPAQSCFSPVSLYPEDSLSMVNRQTYHSEMPSPTETHTALGSLMLQEFPSAATITSIRQDAYSGPELKKRSSRDWKDKPPRVPSPPPLPSLSQMALGNFEPDYRSPIYSIYGYYEEERKSKASYNY